MRQMDLGFDPHEARAEADHMPWEDVGYGKEARRVFLGTVFALFPSGKFYTPFANSNVDECPCCGGTGEKPSSLRPKLRRKWKNRSRRSRKLWVKRYGAAPDWPARVKAASERLNALEFRLTHDTRCPRCGGEGSAEAYDDACWRDQAETALDAVGLSLEHDEDGDPCDLYAVEYRDAEARDDEEGDDDALPAA